MNQGSAKQMDPSLNQFGLKHGSGTVTARNLMSFQAGPSNSNAVPTPRNGWTEQLLELFPHIQNCGQLHHRRMHEYAQRHAASLNALKLGAMHRRSSLSESADQRYLVSVPHMSGTADQVVGLVTQFYLVMLGNRTLTQYVPHGRPPALAAACDFPFFNWTHPFDLPEALLAPLPQQGVVEYSDPNSAVLYPPPYKTYAFHNMVNTHKSKISKMRTEDLRDFPVGQSDVPYVISTCNRGLTYSILSNPHHKGEFWESYGLRPETAFMCGFWSLCTPAAVVQEYYGDRFWRPMLQPNVFTIGIQIRLGDQVTFLQQTPLGKEAQLKQAAPFFACAELVEKEYASPGQKVIWFLLSDSVIVRKAAKSMYPDKVLTDDELSLMHVSCYRNKNEKACRDAKMSRAVQHAVGEMLSFCLADYHIVTNTSGFGRVGAWLSGKWGNIYELPVGVSSAVSKCPHAPTPTNVSASTYSGI